MMTDPISDFLTQIKNGYGAAKKDVRIPFSNLKESLAQFLSKERYVGTVKSEGTGVKKQLVIELLYTGKKPRVSGVVRVSKPGKRVYIGKQNIFKVLGGLGLLIISTPKGIMSDRQAKKQGMGGEVICKIW